LLTTPDSALCDKIKIYNFYHESSMFEYYVAEPECTGPNYF